MSKKPNAEIIAPSIRKKSMSSFLQKAHNLSSPITPNGSHIITDPKIDITALYPANYEYILQDINNLKQTYPIDFTRTMNHKYKSNNWLRLHHETMRRKPFTRMYLLLDEYNNIPK